MASIADVLWLAGQIDGDGCISIYTRTPCIAITKAKKGRRSLDRVAQLYGGRVCSNGHRPESAQEIFNWRLFGRSAQALTERLRPHLHLKRKQADLVARVVTGRFPVTVTKDGETKRPQTPADAALLLGCSVSRIYQLFKQHGDTFTFRGHSVQRCSKQNDALEQQIKEQQPKPHDLVASPLHPAYIAGFVDAEGCIKLQALLGLRVEISQKFRPVLDAIQQQYGGKIIQVSTAMADGGRKIWYQWSICGPSAKAFLMVIKQFLYEKRDQVDIAMNSTLSTVVADMQLLKSMRGHKA